MGIIYLPKATTAEIDALVDMKEGDIIYDKDKKAIVYGVDTTPANRREVGAPRHVTTAQRDAISGAELYAGRQIFNTDFLLHEYYDGDVWLNAHTTKYTNKSGGALSTGAPVIISGAAAQSVTTTTVISSTSVMGVIVNGGANDAFVTVATSGIWDVTFKANETIALGNRVETTNVAGQAELETGSVGSFALAVEAGTDTSAFNLKCQIGILGEIF